MIHLQAVSRWYGQVIGLNDVSLEIGHGVMGLLGPNGAGKSTLIRLVTGQISPSLGKVTVFGQPVFRRPDILTRIGCCPDIERFNDDWTGFAFVRAAAYLSGLAPKEADQRARELLEEVGLKDAGDLRIGSYSKGMRQRVKLAQALVTDPEVLILDEPLTGMDPLGRRQIIEQVRRWGKEGRCVLVSSHVLHEVEAMTENVVLIHHGRVLAEGRVHEIRSLLSAYPHHVTVEVEKPRELAARLVSDVELAGLRFGDRSLTIETTRPDDLYSVLEGLVLDHGVEVRKLYTRDDSLDAVFDYLVD
ncbi:MAG: ABC transporter ATP-binding protein [Planctomycetota bacterium]